MPKIDPCMTVDDQCYDPQIPPEIILTPFPTPSPTPECSCDDDARQYTFVNGQCTLILEGCNTSGATDLSTCCDSNDFIDGMCAIDDSVCPPVDIITPGPTPSPTAGGTTTVAKEEVGAPTNPPREQTRQ